MRKYILSSLLFSISALAVINAKAQVEKQPPPPPPKVVKEKPPKVDISNFKPPPPKVEKVLYSVTEKPKEPPRVEVTRWTDPAGSNPDFYKQNPSVNKILWGKENQLSILYKDKKVEDYDLNNEEQKKKFIDKFGMLPVPPPPPPVPKYKNRS